jgi:lactate 2-monooxygenase
LLKRAKEHGYKVRVVTLDTFNLAWKPTDLDSSYLPFLWGDECQIGTSDPVFNKMYGEELERDERGFGEKMREGLDVVRRPDSLYGAVRVLGNLWTIKKSRAWLDVLNSGTYREWGHLEVLRREWEGPIVLKGIQRVEDAHRAIEYGVDGVESWGKTARWGDC